MSHSLSKPFEAAILNATGASSYHGEELIQSLWSGYGQILRVQLSGGSADSVILKHVKPPSAQDHPRGWNSNRSHDRKVRSYEVETNWYQHWSNRCDSHCRVPELLHAMQHDGEVLLVLEDLDHAGFPVRKTRISKTLIQSCLKWLAEFHATFLGDVPEGLWKTGTYWHLETRPDELAVVSDLDLRMAAPAIDARLSNARFQTLVHGDAKLANFCFSENSDHVAALDFQYVGGGCGIKDVAYFLGSCLGEAELERQAASLLKDYFQFLTGAINRRRPDEDPEAVIAEWSDLFRWAWTDFHRFLQGWSPGHWKINSFSDRVSREVVAEALRML